MFLFLGFVNLLEKGKEETYVEIGTFKITLGAEIVSIEYVLKLSQ